MKKSHTWVFTEPDAKFESLYELVVESDEDIESCYESC